MQSKAIIRGRLGACKGEHGGMFKGSKVRDTGVGDPVVGLRLGVQKWEIVWP